MNCRAVKYSVINDHSIRGALRALENERLAFAFLGDIVMWIESFNVGLDANLDGWVSLAEAWAGLKWLYMLPGNLLLETVGQFPSLAGAFRIRASEETGYASLNGWFSLLFSLVAWLYVLVKLCDLRDWLRQRFASRLSHGNGNNRHHHHHA